MKKVLVITYYWPPSGGAGVQRWLKFVKYLRSFGWEPVVYTPENPEYPETDASLQRDIPDDLTVVRRPIWEPYDIYKKFIGGKKEDRIHAAFTSEKRRNPILEHISVWIRGNFFIPDARAFWIRPSVAFLTRHLKENPVDAIVSTGPPHSMHLIARTVSSRLKIPWLADFRDPWTNIDFYRDLHLTSFADKKHRSLEHQVLSGASAVTVIGDGMALDFAKIVNRHYDVITNGFDPDDLTGPSEIRHDLKFSIAHIGTLSGSRNPETLWQSLHSLLEEIPALAGDLEIKLVGKTDFSVLESVERAGLTPYLSKISYLPHQEAVTCQRQSQLLLLIINDTPNAGMILTGKFFEYLAAGRPILCLGPEQGDAASILQETGAGIMIGYGDIERMKTYLRSCYRQFREGSIPYSVTSIEKYSRVELTREMARVLDRVTG